MLTGWQTDDEVSDSDSDSDSDHEEQEEDEEDEETEEDEEDDDEGKVIETRRVYSTGFHACYPHTLLKHGMAMWLLLLLLLQLAPTAIRVQWLDAPESDIDSSKAVIVDRSFLHGDIVTLTSHYTNTANTAATAPVSRVKQCGTVCDVKLHVTLKEVLKHGAENESVSVKELSTHGNIDYVHPYQIGRVVTKGSMLGQVSDVKQTKQLADWAGFMRNALL